MSDVKPYIYSGMDLLGERFHYQYTPYEGIPFLKSYLVQRETFRGCLEVTRKTLLANPTSEIALAEEIRETISNPYYDAYTLKVKNYIGGKIIANGWGIGPFGKHNYIGLFKKGTKSRGLQRISPEITITGRQAPNELQNPLISRQYENVSRILQTRKTTKNHTPFLRIHYNRDLYTNWTPAAPCYSGFVMTLPSRSTKNDLLQKLLGFRS